VARHARTESTTPQYDRPAASWAVSAGVLDEPRLASAACSGCPAGHGAVPP